MKLRVLVVNEIKGQFASFLVLVFGAWLSALVITSQLIIIRAHDIETRTILAEKETRITEELKELEEEYRKLMLELGLNLYILPVDQNLNDFYSDGYASKWIPESYVDRLAKANKISIQHLLPLVEQKIQWKEQGNRRVILIGTQGEVPLADTDYREPVVNPVSPGDIILGYEIWKGLGIDEDDSLLLNSKIFRVSKLHARRGNKDDITMWIDLNTAQEMLGMQGKLTGIMALQCVCYAEDASDLENEIVSILPGTQLVLFENQVTARMETRARAQILSQTTLKAEAENRARLKKNKRDFFLWFIPFIILFSFSVVIFMSFRDARQRSLELGIFSALGFSFNRILSIFILKLFLAGIFGVIGGILSGVILGLVLSGLSLTSFWELVFQVDFIVIFVAVPFIMGLMAVVPSALAAGMDTADILSRGKKI
ncbi:MAG: ABC transporter permease [Spirochaetales bacterium]|nr:ABC transporter permease [Spirochaetales bacterium]